MLLGISPKFPDSYRVETPIYQGPLDLLLQLIEKAELDITKLALAQVTDQYLQHIKNLHHQETNEISLFLVIASKLLQIKSAVLLPRPTIIEDDEEDLGAQLVSQLIEYKKFREISKKLAEREEKGLRTYLRVAVFHRPETAFDPSGIDLKSLALAARRVFSQTILEIDLKNGFLKPRYSIRQKMLDISRILIRDGGLSFSSLILGNESRLEIVITFLALLELIKQQQVEVQQENLFADIFIQPTPKLTEETFIESEFGE